MSIKVPEKIKTAGKVHIMGIAGQEGRAVFDYLLSDNNIPLAGHQSSAKDEFTETFISFSDAYPESEAKAMAEKFLSSRADLRFGEDYGKGIKKGDAVIVPQAYKRHSLNRRIIDMASSGEIILIQAIELAFSIAKCRTAGITGTAGKSTVTALIREMVEMAGKPLYFSGNDRENKWDFFALESMEKDGIALFEVSHRHLMDLKQSPDIAVLTNIFPHHLDDAGSFDKYVEIKKNIFRFQTNEGVAIVNALLLDNGMIKEEEDFAGKIISFGGEKSEGEISDGRLIAVYNGIRASVSLAEIKMRGEHNFENALAAMLAGLSCGIEPNKVESAVREWAGLKYRQELIGEWNGVRVINDGKSTDPLASIEAVKAVPRIGSLILGGVREGYSSGDFIPLGKIIAEKKLNGVFVFGSLKKDLKEDLFKAGVEAEVCASLEDAVLKAFNSAKNGEAVVFSPGCQSFDEFGDYRDRAEKFNSAVRSLFGKK